MKPTEGLGPCPEWAERITSLVLDGPLTAPDREAILEHLAACAACRERRERLDATVEVVASAAPASGTAALEAARVEAILAEAARGPQPPRVRRRVATLFGAGLAAAVLAVAGRQMWDRPALKMQTGVSELPPGGATYGFFPSAPDPAKTVGVRLAGRPATPTAAFVQSLSLPSGRDAVVRHGMPMEITNGAVLPDGDNSLRKLGYIGNVGDQPFTLADSDAATVLDGVRDEAAARAEMAATTREAVRQYLKAFERLPEERPRDMFFRFFGDNPEIDCVEDALSTFAIDVDSASYTLARASLMKGIVPSRYGVRTEEFVNYFPAETPAPAGGTVFAIASEAAPSPFSSERGQLLLRVAVKGREVERPDRKPLALTLVVDVSDSMREGGRLELAKRAIKILAGELDARDTIAIVKFDEEAERVLSATPAPNLDEIRAAAESLVLEGGTNVAEGLLLGYKTALDGLSRGAMNRVILFSDGVANTGETDAAKMLDLVRDYRAEGIYLNTIGVGLGNHNDALLEKIADEGDGVCSYVDDLAEARRLFVDGLTGTLETIAKDVKIQVAFDPRTVAKWRQLGYENRAVADEDFRNDAVDGGEVGAGHEVVALYEVTPLPGVADQRLGKVSVRWKSPDSGEVSEIEEMLAGSSVRSYVEASRSFRLHALVAEFAEILRESVWARGSRLEDVGRALEPVVEAYDRRKDVVELAALVKQAALLLARSSRDNLARRLADDLAQNAVLRARLEDAGRPEDKAKITELTKQAKEMEAELERHLTGRSLGEDARKRKEELGYISPPDDHR